MFYVQKELQVFNKTDMMCWTPWSTHIPNGKENSELKLRIKRILLLQIRNDPCCHLIRELQWRKETERLYSPCTQLVLPSHLRRRKIRFPEQPAKGKLRAPFAVLAIASELEWHVNMVRTSHDRQKPKTEMEPVVFDRKTNVLMALVWEFWMHFY